MGDFAPGVAGGASVALLIVLFAALFRVVQILFKTGRDCTREVTALRAEIQWERRGKDAMIVACQQSAVPIPPIVWEQRPSVDADVKGGDRDDS